MARPQRFPNKIEFWTNDQQLQGLEVLTGDGLSDKASHLRQAVAMYLRHFGITPARTAQNGQQHHQSANVAEHF